MCKVYASRRSQTFRGASVVTGRRSLLSGAAEGKLQGEKALVVAWSRRNTGGDRGLTWILTWLVWGGNCQAPLPSFPQTLSHGDFAHRLLLEGSWRGFSLAIGLMWAEESMHGSEELEMQRVEDLGDVCVWGMFFLGEREERREMKGKRKEERQTRSGRV